MKVYNRRYLSHAIFLLFASTAQAEDAWFPKEGPQPYVTGMAGNVGIIQGDVLIPVYGDQTHFFYTDLNAQNDFTSTWFASAGLGYRGLFSDHIWGAYVYGDRSVTSNNNTFWTINPGVELLSDTWDFRANAYLPVNQEESVGNSSVIPGSTSFQGHTEYGALQQLYETTGYGVDAEIGRSIPGLEEVRIYAGGYYFNQPDTDNIVGVSGRLEYAMTNRITWLVNNSYDNAQFYTIEAGIRVGLGKRNPGDNNLTQRLLSPTQRNLATFGQATAVPISQTNKNMGYEAVRNNIYFFNSTGNAHASGTYEDPLSAAEFDQSLVNNLNSNSNFYLANNANYNSGAVALKDGQSIYGRSSDFKTAAAAGNHTQINGSLSLPGNNTIDSVDLTNDNTAITVQNNAQNVVLSNSKIIVNGINNSNLVGMTIGANTDVILQNSAIEVSNSGTSGSNTTVNGIQITGASSNLLLDNTSVKVVNSVQDANQVTATGINAAGAGNVVTMQNGSSVNATNNGNNADGQAFARGIILGEVNSSLYASNSTISATNNNVNSAINNAVGVLVANNAQHVQIDNGSSVSGTNTGSATYKNSYGIQVNSNSNSSTVLVQNGSTVAATNVNTVDSSSNSSSSTGILLDGVATNLIVNNSTVSATSVNAENGTNTTTSILLANKHNNTVNVTGNSLLATSGGTAYAGVNNPYSGNSVNVDSNTELQVDE